MQEQWKDLIPFYVAGTLDEQQTKALEAYLQACGAPCQQEIEDWRKVASLTWQQASHNANDLPPLSQAVREQVAQSAALRASGKVISSEQFHTETPQQTSQAPVYPRPVSQRKMRPNSRVPLTMVAAFMTVVIFGGLLISRLNPEDLEPQTILLTEVPNIDIEITDEFGGEVGIVPDSGILATPTAFAPQPTDTPLPPPSIPPEGLMTVTPAPFPTQAQMSELGFNPVEGCMVRNDTQGALTIYRDASFSSNPVGVMREGQENRIRVTFDGWYELSYGRWVYGENLVITGDCSAVITATPTAIGDNPDDRFNTGNGILDCTVRNIGTEPVNLYQWADTNSPVNGQLGVGASHDVIVGENGWYQVFYAQWVNGTDVSIEGTDCDNLWIPTPTGSPVFVPSVTPTINPDEFSGSPVAVVKTDMTIVRTTPSQLGIYIDQFNQGTNLPIVAHNNVTGPQRWYLVRLPNGITGWLPALDVDVIPNDLEVAPAATIPVIPTVTSTPVRIEPTSNPNVTATPIFQSWSHMTTITEHGCGGEVGQQETIPVQIQDRVDNIYVVYPNTGTGFTLTKIGENTYQGSYGLAPQISVELTFNTPTTYTAAETITQESGCIVRAGWVGTKQ